jgi:hypothetical protein
VKFCLNKITRVQFGWKQMGECPPDKSHDISISGISGSRIKQRDLISRLDIAQRC